MILVFIPGIGHARGNASQIPRWIGAKIPGFGFLSFQPVEIAKIAIIIFLSYRLSARPQYGLSSYLYHFPVIIIIVILTILQPNFGSAVILVMISACLIFVSGIRLRNIFSLIFIVAPIIFISLIIKPYRNERILAWLEPYKYPDTAFQLLESFKAFYEGGLLGLGIGQGRVHRVLPDRHNDFIFAITANDYGFIGVCALIFLYMFFTWRTILILRKLQEPFYQLLGFGLLILIIIQAILNMAVVTGLVPTTGISLPFISLGGSNLVINMFGMGLLLNLTAQRHRY
jgi:cell division protein FtsW